MNEQLQTSPRNARELRVVDWLGKRLERRLADRGGGRHEPGWEPRQNVVVGVLEPVIATPDGGTPTSGAESDALLVPEVESLPSLGLDFRARARSNALQVFADVKLAIYLEEYPTREEQLRYEKPEAAIMAPTEEPGESPASPNKAPDAHDLPVPDTSGQLTPETDDPPRKRAARRRTTRLASVWTRVELCVPAITLEIPLTGAVVEGGNELRAAITAAIDLHFSKPSAAREFITRTRQLSADALASDAAFLRAVKEAEDSAFAPIYPQITISGFAERIDDDDYLVSVSITNATVLPERPFQDLTAYDCELRVRLAEGAELVPQRFSLAPADYRYEGLSVTRGHGRGCVALDDGDGLRSTSFPRFTQHVVTPRHDHVPPARWSELGQDPIPLLTATRDAMRQYLRGWDEFISHASPSIREVAETERLQFVDEIRRFDLGISALSLDPRLRQAFTLANRTFARLNAAKPFDSWRLFQFVYIVTNLPALAAREKNGRTDLVSELRDFADVLWFPTGGGKTEAYLGLIVTALFYDRLRGKAHGPTAWLKFPLRMLSVQQLVRVLRILVVAEDLRREATGGVGDPFTLGYMVGSSNTPNNLLNQQGWWPGIDKAGALDQEELDRHRLVAQCPYCHSNKVHLRVDAEQVRIIHGCAACSKDLPLVMSDDEVFRYMPSVVVWTVDKLSGFAWFGEFTQFVHGPKFRCPEHGWFTFPRGKKCLAGPSCRRTPRQYLKEARWHDPGPALIVQDEMHLLKEELGAFDAHYEGLLSELFRGGPSGLPPKLLGASATIEQYEDQLRQVYGRRPRSFPSPGFERSKSFYAAETADVRRVYVGVLPHYRRKADVAGIVQSELLTAVAEIQD